MVENALHIPHTLRSCNRSAWNVPATAVTAGVYKQCSRGTYNRHVSLVIPGTAEAMCMQESNRC